jgi:hypothetical protein
LFINVLFTVAALKILPIKAKIYNLIYDRGLSNTGN